MSSYEQILKEFEAIPVINTHEHLVTEEERLSTTNDIFSLILTAYGATDLVSAGMPRKDLQAVQSHHLSLDLKWELLKPYWEDVQNTSYFVSIRRMCKELYGIDELSENTYHAINEAMLATEKPGLYHEILKEKCNYVTSITDVYKDRLFKQDESLISPMLNSNRFILPISYHDHTIESVAANYGFEINTLGDWDLLIKHSTAHDKEKYNAIAMKIGAAYARSLKFTNPNKSVVSPIFDKMLDGTEISKDEYHIFQDYVLHRIVEASIENDLTIQIHTGLQEGNGNYLENSNPLLLANLFMQYREARFDVLHSSYPYDKEAGVLAKMFPNVCINMCWSHIISREFSVTALIHWLDFVPVNKIFAFGGDVSCPEYSFSGLIIAKENIAKALAHHVDKGSMSLEQAINIGKKMFFDNPNKFYKFNFKV